MTEDLTNLINRAYSSGTIDGLDEAVLRHEPPDDRLRSVLESCAAQCGLNWQVEMDGKQALSFCFTQKNHPPFNQWIWEMGNEEKTSWIQKNGAPYPVLWLRVSRVADYYYHHFNHWTPREDGMLDADFKRLPNAAWSSWLSLIKQRMEQTGFSYLTDELAREKTPFVLERDYDSIPDEDPRWDDANFDPPLVPSTVHECLFSQ